MRFSNAILLSLATVALYWYSFSFEVGYAFYFGYPSELIPVSLSLILNVWVYLFTYLLVLVVFLQLNLQSWPHRGRFKYDFIWIFLLIIALLSVLRALGGETVFLYGQALTLLAYVLGAYLTARAKRQKDNVTNAGTPQSKTQDKLSEIPMIYDARSAIPSDSIAYLLVLRLGFDPVLILFLAAIVLPGLFGMAGYAQARAERQFYTFVSSDTEHVVLRMFDEILIAAPVSRDRCEYAQEFVTVPITSITGLKPISIKCPRSRFEAPMRKLKDDIQNRLKQ